MSFATITRCVVSQRVFIIVIVFVIDSVRKLLDTPSYKTVIIYINSNLKDERRQKV
jgi:uncharacterized membrane protein